MVIHQLLVRFSILMVITSPCYSFMEAMSCPLTLEQTGCLRMLACSQKCRQRFSASWISVAKPWQGFAMLRPARYAWLRLSACEDYGIASKTAL